MKNIKTSMLLAATAVFASSVYAGGPTMMPNDNRPTLFVEAEGGYTWNSLGNTTVTLAGVPATSSKTNGGGSGRGAAGVIHYSTACPNLSYTAEAGAGYYGKTSYLGSSRGVNAQNYIYGLDLLGGVDYQVVSALDLFFKVGGLIENVRMNHNTNLALFNGGSGTTIEKSTASYFIPALKVGGIYNFTQAWGISLAYMHAFGNSPSMSVSKTVDPDVSNSYVLGGPITLNNLLAGLVYKFN